MKLKTKVLTSVLAAGLTAAMIGGSTMAWFTASKEVAPATFTAGTVKIESPTEQPIQEGIVADNVNPGDTFKVKWQFVNDGTKAVQLRVKAAAQWTPAEKATGSLPLTNLANVRISDGWTYQGSNLLADLEAGTAYFLYTGAIPGTKDDDVGDAVVAGVADESGRTVTLTVTGTFDGAKTGNRYQGATLKAGGTVQAIQASHSSTEDGADGWNWNDFGTYNQNAITPALS